MPSIGDKKIAFKNLAIENKRKREPGNSKRRWVNNIKTVFGYKR
jgi:hypothetical protein